MRVKTEDYYFSKTLQWIILTGSVLASGYFIYGAHHQWIIFLLVIMSLISFSTKYVFEVDTEKKYISDSFYFLWIRTKSEEFKFNSLICIRLDKQRHIYNANSRVRDHQADFNEYIGTLEYDQQQEIELERRMDYQSLAQEMKSLAEKLNIPINRTF
jgi:hypothetical protein